MRRWLAMISLAILGSGMSACTITSDVNWKEEVQLSDGRVIVIEREAIYVGGGDEWASNRGGGKIDEYRIRFASPDGSGKTVEWRSTKKDSQTYPEQPLVFDQPAGVPTIFTLVAVSSGCAAYSKYVYRNGTWIEENLPEQFGQQMTNLLFGDKGNLPKVLPLEEKNKRNSWDGYAPAYKQIGPGPQVCGKAYIR